ncbi:hypothetical protein BRADI_2g39285v3 [Brachypodium distachyon]|uniref:Uncharacterized protein n=1 Tax=Brachypodium distachyon TaxID=15368 RepID=A0A0Q3MUM8_BRADI|nr:hypothetical protein BRADI_2g39285v3 [Brachypodium distachyon]PNT72097.1 hypothetical protein BRADI_2g39285v3 [Brachypodium distachyon]PNT72098.1 hypothetical protein BRADI_2g39285v3 [Brachypodium distachyon]PNT72099.1 hypothetical protein BRADI_2g39285v3 [Brachypodium distachyon]
MPLINHDSTSHVQFRIMQKAVCVQEYAHFSRKKINWRQLKQEEEPCIFYEEYCH